MKKYLQTVLGCLCLISAGSVTTVSACAEKEMELTTHSETSRSNNDCFREAGGRDGMAVSQNGTGGMIRR